MTVRRTLAAGSLLLVVASIGCKKGPSTPKAQLQSEAELMNKVMSAAAADGTLRIRKVTGVHRSEELNFELQCPDRLHVIHAEKSDREEIYISDKQYVLTAAGRWAGARGKPAASDESCETLRSHYASLLLREPYSYYAVRDLGESSSRGAPCHRWRLSPPLEGDPRGDLEICISASHQLLSLETDRNLTVEFYDYGTPLVVEPPPVQSTTWFGPS